MKNNKGFTLIELLVVIAIIGLLSTLAVVSLNNAREKSRNARRVSDIKQVQTALELYYNDEGGYPESARISAGGALTGPTSGVTYMSTLPTAPTPNDGSCTGGASGNNTYTYAAVGNSPFTSYTLSYCLGSETGGIPAGPQTATPAGIQ